MQCMHNALCIHSLQLGILMVQIPLSPQQGKIEYLYPLK